MINIQGFHQKKYALNPTPFNLHQRLNNNIAEEIIINKRLVDDYLGLVNRS